MCLDLVLECLQSSLFQIYLILLSHSIWPSPLSLHSPLNTLFFLHMPSSPPNTHTHTLYFSVPHCILHTIFNIIAYYEVVSAPLPPFSPPPLQALHSMFLPQPLPVAVLQLQRVGIGGLGVAASSLQREVGSVQPQTELTSVLSVGGIVDGALRNYVEWEQTLEHHMERACQKRGVLVN